MLKYLLHRLLQGAISLGIITVIIFMLTRLLGDPVVQLLPPTYTPEEYDRLASALGYDQPVHIQFMDFLGGLVRGDLGTSITRSEPVVDVLASRIPVTLYLAVSSLLLGFGSALILGFVAAYSRSRFLDSLTTLLATLGMAVPSFAVGILLVVTFSIGLGMFPAGGWGTGAHAVLPVATLTIWMFSNVARIARSTMQERSAQQYVTLAQTKGLSAPHVLLRHAARPSMPPVISYGAVLAGTLFSGTVVTEVLFGIPGLGALAVDAVSNRDQPLVIGIVMLSAVIFIALNLISDVLTAILDPRVRLGGSPQ
ncbi:ABC transporter permease [Nesterenkonia ebinurensis]|uniref:ABC transporter permease n=1 Tax=Nesterenkonia ebinurensis TaxID=2608252 RepID=UPI00123DD882|nr:ABC transporter permease [Nesterenkonia ebinurensis]